MDFDLLPTSWNGKRNRYANLAATQFEKIWSYSRSSDLEWHHYEAEAERLNDGWNGLEVLTDFRTKSFIDVGNNAEDDVTANDSSVVTTKRIA